METSYQVLSFYCFTFIEDPAKLRETQHLYCLEKKLRGRIKVAPEGINGKISGLTKDCQGYIKDLLADSRFQKADFKIDDHNGYASEKLHVKVKKEIVNAGLSHIKPYERAGIHLTPKAFEKMIQEDDVIILDVRSNYENAIGKFKGAVTLDINNFRELPQQIESLKKYREKKIITTCTGGIKTEKASAYLLSQGFKNVYQLQGGILRYGKETNGAAFEGSCYIFDNRLTREINSQNPTLISQCYLCHTPSKRLLNCANMLCNRHVPICHPCGEKLAGTCSKECLDSPKKRTYNGSGYYTKQSNGYNPYKGLKRNPLPTKI